MEECIMNEQIDFSAIRNAVDTMQERIVAEAKLKNAIYERKEQRYYDSVTREERMIELLESIDKNTSLLSEVIILLEENTKDQKQILEIINDFNALATVKDKETIQSQYRKIMKKINTTISDVNTINTLCGYGMTIYNMLKNFSS